MKRDGTLEETPLPVLLDGILREERTCTLELKLRQLEKRIVFEDGAPVACASNLLHETLGKYLVEKGKLTEAQYQAALGESISTGAQMGELLVQKQLVAPFDLYKQLQANLAHKILDCFRWGDAKWKLIPDAEPSKSALTMNSAQLILTGTSNFLPFDIVATHLTFTDDQRFAAVPTPPPHAADLKLSGKDARFFQALRSRPTFNELMAATALDVEAAMRKLYALVVLGLVGFADQVNKDAQKPTVSAQAAAGVSGPAAAQGAGQAATPAAGASAAAAPMAATLTAATPASAAGPAGVPYSDEDPALRDALMAAFLEHRTRDPFAQLGVDEDAQAGALKKAFLAVADRFSPVRFHTAELKEKAEALLLAYARAFSALADPEQAALWKKRRAAAAEKKRSEVKPSTADQFRIRTDLLDARSQFEDGKARLAEGNARGALEYFEYACDIDPKPLHRAYRAWSRFQLDPERNAKLALQELTDTLKDEAGDEPFRFAAEIHRKFGNWADAETMFRKAFKLNPANRGYADAIATMVKAQQKR